MTIALVVGSVFGLYVVGFSFGIGLAIVFNFFDALSR